MADDTPGLPPADEHPDDRPTRSRRTSAAPRRGSEVYVARLSDRALAWLIDTVIVSIPSSIVFSASGRDLGDLLSDPPLGIIALTLLAAFLYEVPLVATSGRTLGKRLRHLQVVHREDGTLPGWNTSVTRWLTKFGGQLFGLLIPGAPGLLYELVDVGFGFRKPLRQCIHDLAASTVVISDR